MSSSQVPRTSGEHLSPTSGSHMIYVACLDEWPSLRKLFGQCSAEIRGVVVKNLCSLNKIDQVQ